MKAKTPALEDVALTFHHDLDQDQQSWKIYFQLSCQDKWFFSSFSCQLILGIDLIFVGLDPI